jgi:hypothetical protein
MEVVWIIYGVVRLSIDKIHMDFFLILVVWSGFKGTGSPDKIQSILLVVLSLNIGILKGVGREESER